MNETQNSTQSSSNREKHLHFILPNGTLVLIFGNYFIIFNIIKMGENKHWIQLTK